MLTEAPHRPDEMKSQTFGRLEVQRWLVTLTTRVRVQTWACRNPIFGVFVDLVKQDALIDL